MKRITVFCGSSAGIDSTSCRKQPFSDKHWQSIKLNLFMAALMLDLWAVADGVLNGGGTVIGVILIFKIKRNRSQWIDGTNCRR
jgi:predicted Rossmann-fold nucleotide-binding protein